MNCPICSAPLSKHFVAGDFSWCESCRTLFSFSSLQNSQTEVFLCLKDDSEFPGGMTYSRTDDCETVSTRTFSFWGILPMSISLFYILKALVSLDFHYDQETLMVLILLGIATIILTILSSSCRLSLTFYPKSGLIGYAKGPFRWLSVKRKFNGKDVVKILECTTIPFFNINSVVFFKNGKNLMLDFSKQEYKREFLELVLRAFITRA